MYSSARHPEHCNYYYAMRELLGLDPRRKEDKEEFQMLIDQGEIRIWEWAPGKFSDSQYDTDSILAYQRRVREKVKKELAKFTKAIEDMRREFKMDLGVLTKSIDSLAAVIGGLVKAEKERDIPPWQKKG